MVTYCYMNLLRSVLDRRASPGIFIGYSSFNKAYKNFQPQIGNIIVSMDVHFMEDEELNLDDAEKKGQNMEELKLKGTRLLSNVYERCNVALCEPADYAEEKKDQRWIDAMEEELSMIEKKKLGS
ncbi:hypothetical protein V8G54_034060 [Vigna mungo]|uniref:Retroviral polymerase SH3-like domain-containing protein n=1 Tax=Vigna mungo TaxID=3915 RepID=A0AAQ3MPR8_VIGMU